MKKSQAKKPKKVQTPLIKIIKEVRLADEASLIKEMADQDYFPTGREVF